MPLKEESPADTGISDLPIFTDSHESTAKSTPASTSPNASQQAKPEGDDFVMALSAAGATVDPVASVTILSDDMPATPFSLTATSRLCSPQSAATMGLDKGVAGDCVAVVVHDHAVRPGDAPAAATPPADGLLGNSNSSSSAIINPLATPPDEPRSPTPMQAANVAVDFAEAEAAAEAEITPEVHMEEEASNVAKDFPTEEEPAQSVEALEGIAAVTDAAEATNGPTDETPVRQSRRLSSRRASSAAAALPQPQPQLQSVTQTSPSPASRPVRAARLSSRLSLDSPMVARTAAKPAGKPSPSAAAKSTAAKQKPLKLPAAERRITRLSGTIDSLIPNPGMSSLLGKRGRRLENKKASIPRELRRLEDTKEFSHVDEKPVIYTVWSNGKYVPANAAGEPLLDKKATAKTADSGKKATASGDSEDASADSPRKRAKLGTEPQGAAGAEEGDDQQDYYKPAPRRVKKWLDKGLYAGQPMPSDPAMGLNAAEKKALAKVPELATKFPENKTLPMPIFTGMRLLVHGRDFKMPFDVFNPLPPGQPKPVKYGRFSKNRFVGDAHAIWRKNPDFDDFSSKCVCKPETGCDEDCQNRIMLYECDDMNCNVGPERCNNREFQRLAERTASKNPYHIGVEVFKTTDRGHGIRASRSFKPGQIIMEYIGEIITEEESDRRMNELYKNNACYYLMSFDQSLIIDGTSGSIARFVNHSCSPNCRMIKWIVSGQPRIALFAGDRPIMTGEELTYDYNFDPYSSKNVQTCLCGSENCRGVLGPRKRDKAATKVAAEKAAAEKAEKAALLLSKNKTGKGKNAKRTSNLLGKRNLDAYNTDNDEDDSSAGGPAAKRAGIADISKRGPGRPRTPDAGKKTKASVKVTTTKAALAALAAKAAKDARAAKAAKAAKAARLAKAAASTSPIESAKATAVAGDGKSANDAEAGKAAKIVKAAKGVTVTKVARGLKAAKTNKTKIMTTKTKTKMTTTTTTKKTTALKPTKLVSDAATPRKRSSTKPTGHAPKKIKGDKAGLGQKPKAATNTEAEAAHPAVGAEKTDTTLQATPMARALAKAAKEAAKAAKAAKTAETVGKIKPKSAVAKRAMTMAVAATKRASKAKMTAAKAEKVGRLAGKAGKAVMMMKATEAEQPKPPEHAKHANHPEEPKEPQEADHPELTVVQPPASQPLTGGVSVSTTATATILKEVAKTAKVTKAAKAAREGLAKKGGPLKVVQEKLKSPTVGPAARRKPKRPLSAKKTESTVADTGAVKIKFVDVSRLTGGKRPVGRPRGSKKAAKQLLAPLVQPASEEAEQPSKLGGEIAQGMPDVVQKAADSSQVGTVDSAEDVIHVASSMFSAAV